MEFKHRHLFEWLLAFTLAPWWDRMWITQEVVVPREFVLTYGKSTMPFVILAVVARAFKTRKLDLISDPDNLKLLNLLATKARIISELRRLQLFE